MLVDIVDSRNREVKHDNMFGLLQFNKAIYWQANVCWIDKKTITDMNGNVFERTNKRIHWT